MISIEAIATANHEVPDFPAQVLAVLALDPVLEVVIEFRYPQADRRAVLSVPEVAAQPWVDALVGLQLFARTGTRVGQAVVEQAIEHLGVSVVAFALADHLAVPLKTVAFQGIEDRRLGTGFFPGRVEVFHAQQPAAAHGAGIEVGRKGRYQGAEMQVAAGRGGEAPDVRR